MTWVISLIRTVIRSS